MSVEAMTAVLHHSKATGSAKLVLLGIANHEGDGGAWPTVETLAKYAGLTGKRENQERTVQRLLGKLVQLGELRRDVNAGGTADRDWWARPNLYRVLVSCPVECDRTTAHRVSRPVDNQSGTPRSANHPPVSQPGGPPGQPTGQTVTVEPDANHLSASTTDRARASWPHDGERPPAPANPPADELRRVREQLQRDAEAVRRRERGEA